MASESFLETMVSPRQKQMYLKFELLEYEMYSDEFQVIDEVVVRERKMPNGLSNVNGSIDINIEQEIRTTFSIDITNEDGINNWGGFAEENEFKWWLDKRLNIFIGIRIDDNKIYEEDDEEVEYVQMGHFLLTHFKSNHSMSAFPTTQLQGGSKEVLFSTRRGKFLYPTTIYRNTVIIEAMKKILEDGREKTYNIKIDPDINETSIMLDDGENLGNWQVMHQGVQIWLDHDDHIVGDSSLRLDIMPNTTGLLLEKTFLFPLDFQAVNAIAVWARASRNIPPNSLWLVLIDGDGGERELPMQELVGHVIDGGKVLGIDNWRNCLLPISEFETLDNVVKMQVRLDAKIPNRFTLWLDNIVCAEIRNMLPYDLQYGAGDSRWSAIQELADLMDCSAYYDEYGKFILKKRKFPKERHGADFPYDVYEVLEPVITYRDTDRGNNLYGGGDDLFEEHELANHVQVVGGSTDNRVASMVDMALYGDGLHIKEKGKVMNSRGKIRAIDQFLPNAQPTILNENSIPKEIWKRHKNEEVVVKEYPDGFPHLTQPPISNFTIEKIGDFIHHHNNASPDPIIVYSYEGKNRALWELRRRMAYAEQLDIISVPYYILRGEDIIRIEDSLLDIDDNFQIKSMSIPLNGDYMSISAVKIKNLLLDIPYFDLSYLAHNACWYGYDACALTFTFPL